MKKVGTKWLIVVLAMILVLGGGLMAFNVNNHRDDGMMPCPDYDFSDNMVMVLFTEEASAIDRVWIPADFPEFAFSEIKDWGLLGCQRYLTFHLAEPSKDNVLKAIYKLNTRPEIYSAEVSGFDYPC